ncbi:hypothetical protein RR48_14396 [Papilio machaon]|uniref:Uncharacterized protein n=1 Tax=Papilio machaon TaxID=76193 RepID=A0A194QKN0_PAPMA|nr:hypothetical protein RR48_14396 [Papilio machaon]
MEAQTTINLELKERPYAEDDASACDSDAAAEAAAAFARACAPDTQRLLGPHSPLASHSPHTQRRMHDHDE